CPEPRTRSASTRPHDGSRRPLDLQTCRAHSGFSNADGNAFDVEPLDDHVGDGCRQSLEERELPAGRQPADRVGDLAVVDGVLDAIGKSPVCDGHANVVEEVLAMLALLGRDAMPAEDAQPCELDLDHGAVTAAATVSASTCSRTSCTRSIVAPRS